MHNRLWNRWIVLQHYTRMLDQEVAGVHTALTASDWAARVTGLQTLRGLVTASAGCKEQLLARLSLLEPGLEAAVADLRSQVVREACVTVAFIAQQHQYQVSRHSILSYLFYVWQRSSFVKNI